MSAPFVPALDTFTGGQMTDLPAFTATILDGTELFEIVSGAPQSPTNASNAVNYSITSQQMAALLTKLAGSTVIIAQGQYTNPASPYVPGPTMGRIYVNKVTPEPTYIQLAAANTYIAEPLICDVAGTADNLGNGITCTFSNSEKANGFSTVPINTPYGGYFFRPIAALNSWILGTN